MSLTKSLLVRIWKSSTTCNRAKNFPRIFLTNTIRTLGSDLKSIPASAPRTARISLNGEVSATHLSTEIIEAPVGKRTSVLNLQAVIIFVANGCYYFVYDNESIVAGYNIVPANSMARGCRIVTWHSFKFQSKVTKFYKNTKNTKTKTKNITTHKMYSAAHINSVIICF